MMHDEKFKRVATPHTVTKSKAALPLPFRRRENSLSLLLLLFLFLFLSLPGLLIPRAKADMYQFETRARHMYPKAIPRTSTNGEVEVDGEENDEGNSVPTYLPMAHRH